MTPQEHPRIQWLDAHLLQCRHYQNESRGDLSGYGTVWYHPDGIANILSLAEVHKQFHVTYDSSQQNEFVVHKPDGTTK